MFGDRRIGSIRPSEVQAFVTGLSSSLAPGSIRTVFTTVRAIFGAATHDRMIGRDPALKIKLPEIPRALVIPLTVEQVDALVDAVAPPYRSLVFVGAGTGLRQGELFGLQVADVDFLRKMVKVDRQVQPAPGGVVAPAPLKNRSSYRSVPGGEGGG